MAAGKQGRIVKFDPCCGTRASRASGTCSCFYLWLWKNNNIDIPMQNADTYLFVCLFYVHEQYNVIVYFLDLLAPICVICRKLREIQHV